MSEAEEDDAVDAMEAELTLSDAIRKAALRHSPAAVELLVTVLLDGNAHYADRLKAAQHILEVSGCLSL